MKRVMIILAILFIGIPTSPVLADTIPLIGFFGTDILIQVPCVDNDGDGYGNPANQDCAHPELDCDDANADVNPGATETCNGVDDDCDGIVPADESDGDFDGWMVCEGDCDDSDRSINPGVSEGEAQGDCDDGIDNDCDGSADAADPDCPGNCLLRTILR